MRDFVEKLEIENYWKDKPVRFAYKNNCVGCFHRSELFLKHISTKSEKQFDWFMRMEQKNGCTFKSGITYEKIKNHLGNFDIDFDNLEKEKNKQYMEKKYIIVNKEYSTKKRTSQTGNIVDVSELYKFYENELAQKKKLDEDVKRGEENIKKFFTEEQILLMKKNEEEQKIIRISPL